MKRKKLCFTFLAVLVFSFYSCDEDRCDEGYTQVEENGTTICLPDFLVGIENSNDYGNKFYHKTHGIITFENGTWYNTYGDTITQKDVLNY